MLLNSKTFYFSFSCMALSVTGQNLLHNNLVLSLQMDSCGVFILFFGLAYSSRRVLCFTFGLPDQKRIILSWRTCKYWPTEATVNNNLCRKRTSKWPSSFWEQKWRCNQGVRRMGRRTCSIVGLPTPQIQSWRTPLFASSARACLEGHVPLLVFPLYKDFENKFHLWFAHSTNTLSKDTFRC